MSLVEIKNLEHRYGNHTVLAGLNLTLEEGEIIGLLGPNGVGKTTLMKILCGLIQNYDGRYWWTVSQLAYTASLSFPICQSGHTSAKARM